MLLDFVIVCIVSMYDRTNFSFQNLVHYPWILDRAEHQELNAGTSIQNAKAASPLCIVDVTATTIILKIKNNAKRCVRRDLVSKIYLKKNICELHFNTLNFCFGAFFACCRISGLYSGSTDGRCYRRKW